jgi:hypothetical protein
MFLKRKKFIFEIIFLNIVNFLLHHVARDKNVNEPYDNLCATFERQHLGNRLQLCQKIHDLKMDENILMQVHIHKRCMIVDKSTNNNHVVFNEDLAFALLRSLLPMLVTYLIT